MKTNSLFTSFLVCALIYWHTGTSQVWIQQGAGFSIPRTILNIFPVNDQIVWASTLNSYWLTKTTDGGNSWTIKSVNGVPGLVNSMVCAIDETTAWMAMNKAAGTTPAGIYKTTDGGDNWVRQNGANFSGATSFPDIIYFWDADKGVCIGDPVNGEFEIYTTTNGGFKWDLVPGSHIPDALPNEAAHVSMYAVSGNTIWFPGYMSGRVFKSTDFGNNWSVAGTVGLYIGSSWGCPIAFKDSSNGLILSSDQFTTPPALDFTNDGGTTFSLNNYSGIAFNRYLNNVPGTDGTYASVGYSNSTTNLGLTFTNDDGNTWISEPNIYGTPLNASAWVNDSVGWVGGNCTLPTNGIYKFNNVLALVSDFSTTDTAIMAYESVQFENLSKGRFTSYKWTFSGGNPSTSYQKTPPPVVYNTPGNYDVSLKVTGALGTTTKVKSNYIHVTVNVGVDESLKQNSELIIYPNPATGILTVELQGSPKNINGTLYMFNLAGKEVFQQKLQDSKSQINISSLTDGIYFIKLVNDSNVRFVKFVKN